MKSLRRSLTLSILFANILVICLLSLSIVFSFFRITAEWNSGLTKDITALLNHTISEKYQNIRNLEELDSEDFINLVENILDDYKGRLRSIRFISLDKTTLFTYNIADKYDNTTKIISPLELIYLVSIIRTEIFHFRPESSGILIGQNNTILGEIEIFSSPFMGYKYTMLFDRTISTSFFAGIILASLISFVISFYISEKLSHQLKIFAAQLSELAEGKRNVNFTSGSTFEIKSAVDAAKSLQEQLGFNEKNQQQRLQDILHDLKTPVSALGIQFEAIQDNVLQLNNERIGLLSSEFKKIEEMITELSKYTRLTSEEYNPQNESIIINDMINTLRDRFVAQAIKKKQILKINELKTNDSIYCDRIGLQRVLNNLTINALNNAPEGSTIIISSYQKKRMADGANQLFIEIENEGRLDEGDLPFIFDRLYRSKKSGYNGNGLGLAISKTIVEKNGGKITAMNTAFNTVIFRIELSLKT